MHEKHADAMDKDDIEADQHENKKGSQDSDKNANG